MVRFLDSVPLGDNDRVLASEEHLCKLSLVEVVKSITQGYSLPRMHESVSHRVSMGQMACLI
jgi:hypothetical protein